MLYSGITTEQNPMIFGAHNIANMVYLMAVLLVNIFCAAIHPFLSHMTSRCSCRHKCLVHPMTFYHLYPTLTINIGLYTSFRHTEYHHIIFQLLISTGIDHNITLHLLHPTEQSTLNNDNSMSATYGYTHHAHPQ